MSTYENNSATQLVEDALWGFDFVKEALPGKDTMEAISSTAVFYEYVYKHAVRCGYAGDAADSEALVSFVSEKCNEAGLALGSGTKPTLRRWFKNGLPANTADGRENVYRLCFALQMDARQTREFFFKAYLERPFNYKNIREAAYFFCLNNGLAYSDAQRIISNIEALPNVENPNAEVNTEQIGERLSELTTEEQLLHYIAENRSGFEIQNQSATAMIRKLRDDCMKVASKEYAISNPLVQEEIAVNNIDELLSIIYGYSARATSAVRDEEGKVLQKRNGKPVTKPIYKQSISKSGFPELIRKNWPQREQFAQILEKSSASYDVIRRALIMLSFYHFFAHAMVAEAEAKAHQRKTGIAQDVARVEDGLYYEFVDELNGILSECGYVQLYWRNPFDWMFGYCAMSPNPLDTFRELIEEYYLSDPDTIDQPEL